MRILLCSFSAAAALGLNAATYHVAVSGSNAANGLTLSTAWATVQHAADMAIAGDSVLVHPGSYAGFAAMDNSGTANAPIVRSTARRVAWRRSST